uniref:Peptidase A2 domain-containing protein n=1 Tax=Latimeria chalumnae TaxID=7897 RepID=H2ZXE1_LATCH
MGPIGKISEFDETREDFDSYLERYEMWMDANEIGRKASKCFPVCNRTPSKLIAPDKPKDKAYLQLAQILTGHYKPKPLIIVEWSRFYCQDQKDSGTIIDYIVALKQFLTNCEFGAFLSEALRDRFVCGLKNESIQKKPLSEKDLIFQSASEIALAMELASKNSQESAGKMAFQPCGVNKVWGSDKPAAERKQSPGAYTEKGGMNKCILQVKVKRGLNFQIHLDNKPVDMQLDTGATVTIVPETVYKKKLSHIPLESTSLQLKTYSGEKIALLGKVKVQVTYGEQSAVLPLVMAEVAQCMTSLCNTVKQILTHHKAAFGESWGPIKNFKAKIKLQLRAEPLFHKPWLVPYALHEHSDKELARLDANGIMSKVERSKWAAPILVVPK